MKKNILIALVFVLVLSLAACGTQQPEASMPPEYCDEAFLNDFTAGLMARWDLTDNENSDENKDKSERELLTEYINAELSKIEQYRSGLFEDSKLQERAIAYINLLHDQQDALAYINSDYSKYSDLWADAYNKRTQMISAFIADYNLEFPEAYSETVADITTNAKVVTEKNELDQKVQQMVDALNFEMVQNDYGYKTYRAVVENITDQNFSDFSVDVSLINADGVLIATEYAYVENLSPGQKGYMEFFTDQDFATYELTLNYYDVT